MHIFYSIHISYSVLIIPNMFIYTNVIHYTYTFTRSYNAKHVNIQYTYYSSYNEHAFHVTLLYKCSITWHKPKSCNLFSNITIIILPGLNMPQIPPTHSTMPGYTWQCLIEITVFCSVLSFDLFNCT